MLFSLGVLKNKKILITGGTGFFGKNLCEYLNYLNNTHHLNLKIYVMARREEILPGVEFIQQDLTKEIKTHLQRSRSRLGLRRDVK